MKLVVFGAGYVGLVTGAGLADLGHEVLVVEKDAQKAAALARGEVPIHEPGLSDLIRRNARGKRLSFASAPVATADAVAYFIAVGTPPLPDGSADVSAVFEVVDQIVKIARRNAVVVVKSTVPVGTCDRVQGRLRELEPGSLELGSDLYARDGLEAVSNPEFLKEGDALADFFKPDRVVVGAQNEGAREVMRKLYAPLNLSGERPLLFMDPRSAELVKYAANAMLASRISFMNEISRLCDAAGASVHDVRLGVGSDSRIGKKFLYAGPGYGGSCFPKDVLALVAMGRTRGIELKLARAAHEANEDQARYLAGIVGDLAGFDQLAGKTIAIWGLAFKPETDDVRESPALKLMRMLHAGGARVVGHDPEAIANFARALPGAWVVDRELDACDGADVLVLLTEWRCYRAPDFAEIAKRMKPGAAVVDARNVWRREDVVRAGLRYRGVGVPPGDP